MRTNASLVACLVCQMAGLPASSLLDARLPSAVPSSCIFPRHRGSEGGRERERKIESERERDRVRKPELFEGLPDGRFFEKLLGRLIASLACGLASWCRPSLAGRVPGWMLAYFAPCLQACLSPPPALRFRTSELVCPSHPDLLKRRQSREIH